MEIVRLRRVIRDRWWVVVIFAVVGVATALAFTQMSNQNQTRVFEATAALRFEPVEGETIADLADDLAQAESVATIAAGDLLLRDETSLIRVDLATGRLEFIAQGETPQEASDKAQALIQAFFDIDPTIGGNVDDLLLELEAEAVAIDARIAELTPELTPAEQALFDQHVFYESQLAAISARLVGIVVDEAVTPEDELEALQEEKTSLEESFAEVSALKAALGPVPVAELTTEEALELSTLENRQIVLNADYERLFLRKLGVTGVGRAEPVTFIDITADPADPMVNGGIGLVAGVLIAVFALMFATRARKPVWLPEDMPIPVLGTIPARRAVAHVAETWYDSAEGTARKAEIQALRSVVEAQLPDTGGTLAISSHNVPSEGSHALAIDLAVAVASAGSSVLLVDADLESSEAIGEYRADGASLAGVFEADPDSMAYGREIQRMVDGAYLMRPGLAVVPSGPPPPSPADALAGRQFRTFVDKAVDQFDLVVVAVGDIASPGAQVAMRRLRKSLLVVTPGRSTMPEIDGLLLDVGQRQVTVFGSVFLEKHERSLRKARTPVPVEKVSASETGEGAPEEGDDESSPLSRLSSYPDKDSMEAVPLTAVATSEPVVDRVLAAQESGSASEAMLGSELLEALDGAGSGAFDAVAQYLVTRTEDMLTSGYESSDLSEDLFDAVLLDGFLSLRPLPDRQTVGQWHEEELRREVSGRAATAITEEMEEVLANRVGRAITIDEWISDQFFKRHLARTDGEPDIWHLSSDEGTAQVLVAAKRLDRARFETLATEVGGKTIEELERYRKAAEARGDLEQADVFEGRANEVRAFSAALRDLMSGGWAPDWNAGTRANIGPVQRAGLLPVPVLSDEELSARLNVG